MFSKRRKPDPQKSVSPLEAKKREIAEKEARMRAEMERCQRLIREAPKLAEKIAKARREQVIARASRTDARKDRPATLPDRWRPIEVNSGAPGKRSRLRSERRQGRLVFFLLLFTLLGVAYWLYYMVSHS